MSTFKTTLNNFSKKTHLSENARVIVDRNYRTAKATLRNQNNISLK